MWRGEVFAISDCLVSFGTTFEDALNNLTLILERFRTFEIDQMSSVPDLGAFLGPCHCRRGLECNPKKIEDVKSWPVPDCLKSVRQFLGFVGYYRRFIPSFVDLAEPLVALTGKGVPFVWRPVCTTAFLQLRDALVRAPILAFPTESGDYILDTDASNFGLGEVLSQIQNDHRLLQSRPPSIPAEVLHHEKRDVGSCLHVYIVSFIPARR